MTEEMTQETTEIMDTEAAIEEPQIEPSEPVGGISHGDSSEQETESYEQFKARMDESDDSRAVSNAVVSTNGTEEQDAEAESEVHEEESDIEQPEPESKIWKLKVNGKEVEFDASDEERVKAEVQKAYAANEKFQHAARVQKQAERFLEMLQSNPEAVLSHPSLGINVREWAENYLYKQLQMDQMSPEEKQAMKEREELEQYRQSEAERKKQEETQKLEQMKEQYRTNYQEQFIDALDRAGIPKNDWSIKRMADYMRQAIKKGYGHITPQEVAPMVKQDWLSAQRELLSSLDGEQLIEMVGKDTAEKIRKHQLAQANKANPYQKPQGGGKKAKPQSNKKKYSSLYDFVDGIK